MASAVAYRWVLTTTTSASAARSRAASAKHPSPDGQRAAPGQSRDPTLTWAQATGARLPRQLGPVPASAAGRPGDQPADLPAERTRYRRLAPSRRAPPTVEHELLVTAGDLGDPLAADVVGPALEHGELDGHAE